MNSAKTVKLAFKAPVHFGNGRLSDGTCACDAGTLFGALFIEAMHMGRSDDLLEAARSGELLLSDAFPYIGNELYLPKPMAVHRFSDASDPTKDTLAKKSSKKLSYIPSTCYADFLESRMDSVQELTRFRDGLGHGFLQTKVNLTRQHKEDAEPYGVGGFMFLGGSGLYFMVGGSFDIVPMLDQLQFSGIGGERSSGFGRFEYEIVADNPMASVALVGSGANGLTKGALHHQRHRTTVLPAQKRARFHVLLSTAAPSRDELSDYLISDARYKLVRKGGFVQSATHHNPPQKKRDLYLFTSGSVFRRTFEGDVFDVNATPGAHPVYRYAKAMWMEV